MSKHSDACCTIPPVVSEGYSPKGDYITLSGLKTYVTGPKDADTAILVIYDIFGYTPQILQGADILANADHHKKYQVFMPDFFEGEPANMAWYPPDTEDQKANLNKWLERAAPPKHLPKIQPILSDAQKHNASITTWGAIGYCWGGKLTSILGAQHLFKAAVQTSPAMIDAADAAKVKIPMAMLASKDENADEVTKYKDNLSVPAHIETFSDQLHGFMSARANLKNDRERAEYERGYQVSLQFFHDHL